MNRIRRGTSAVAADPTDPVAPDFRVANSPFYWLVRVAHRYSDNMDAHLKQVGMDVPRWRVLMTLTEVKLCSVSYLADQAATKLSTMTRTVQRLEADHMVKTRPSAIDGRVTEVLLADAGRRAVSGVRDQASRVYRGAFEGIDAAQIAQLNATLKAIFDNLNHQNRG